MICATLVPAYGRDYKNKSEVEAAFHASMDFGVPSSLGSNNESIECVERTKEAR